MGEDKLSHREKELQEEGAVTVPHAAKRSPKRKPE